MPDLRKTLGYAYLQDTKFDRRSLFGKARPQVSYVNDIKEYSGKEKISMQPKVATKNIDLWQALQQRRSIRKYGKQGITIDDLALLLWATQGVTAQAGRFLLRTAPSAGALYPVESYVFVEQVNNLSPGIFHYNVPEMALERLNSEPAGKLLSQAALDQAFIAGAAVTFVWSAILRRSISKYGHRAMRYIFLDAGHICQNLLIAVEALGLAACPVAAFYDEECNELLGLDGEEESVIYMASVGPKMQQ